jgi:hypothetical protein
MKNFLQKYDRQVTTQEFTNSSDSLLAPVKPQLSGNDQETIMDSLRNQMLFNNLEKLEKFMGKSLQNMSQWIRKIEQTMHIFKMTDE